MYHPTSLGNAFLEACAILFFLCLLLLALLSLFKVPDVYGGQEETVKNRVRQAADSVSRAVAGDGGARRRTGIRNEAPPPIHVPARVSANSINQDLLLSAAPAELRELQRGEVLESPRPISAGLTMADRPSETPAVKEAEKTDKPKKKVKIQEPVQADKVDPTVAGAREKKEDAAFDKVGSEEIIKEREAKDKEKVEATKEKDKQKKDKQKEEEGAPKDSVAETGNQETKEKAKEKAKEKEKEKEKEEKEKVKVKVNDEDEAAKSTTQEEPKAVAASEAPVRDKKKKRKKEEAGDAVASTAVEETKAEDAKGPAKSAKSKDKEAEPTDEAVPADKSKVKDKGEADSPAKSGDKKKQGTESDNVKEKSEKEKAKKDEAEDETADKSSKKNKEDGEAEVVGHRDRSAKDKSGEKGKARNGKQSASKDEADADADADAEEKDEEEKNGLTKKKPKPAAKEAARQAALKRQRDDLEALRNERELEKLRSRGAKEEQEPSVSSASNSAQSEVVPADNATRFNAREKSSNSTAGDANPDKEERNGLSPSTRADAAERRKKANQVALSEAGVLTSEARPDKPSDRELPQASAPPEEASQAVSPRSRGQMDQAADEEVVLNEASTSNDRAIEASADRGGAFASRRKDERFVEDASVPPPSPETLFSRRQKVEEESAEETNGRTSEAALPSDPSPDQSRPEAPRQSARDQRQHKREEEKRLKRQKAQEAKEAARLAEEKRSLELATSRVKITETAGQSEGVEQSAAGSVEQANSTTIPTKESTPAASAPPPWEPMEGRLGQDDIRGITGQDTPEPAVTETVPLTFREQVERETVRPQRVAQALDAKYSLNNLTPDNTNLPPPTYADSREQDVADIHAVVRDVTGADVAAEVESAPLRSRPAGLPSIAQGRRTEQLIPDKGDEPASPAREPLYVSVPDEKERHKMLDDIVAKREAASRRQRRSTSGDLPPVSQAKQGRDNSSGSSRKAATPETSSEPSTDVAGETAAVKPLHAARADMSPSASPKEADKPGPTRSAMKEAAARRDAAMRARSKVSPESNRESPEDRESISVMKEAAARRVGGSSKRHDSVPQSQVNVSEDRARKSHKTATPDSEQTQGSILDAESSGSSELKAPEVVPTVQEPTWSSNNLKVPSLASPSEPKATNSTDTVSTAQEPTWSFDNLREPQQASLTGNNVKVPEPSTSQQEVVAEVRGQKVKGRSFGHRPKKDRQKYPPPPITVAPDASGSSQVSPISGSARRAHEARQEARAAGLQVPPSPAISDVSPEPIEPTVTAADPLPTRQPTKQKHGRSRRQETSSGEQDDQAYPPRSDEQARKGRNQSSDAKSSAQGNQSRFSQEQDTMPAQFPSRQERQRQGQANVSRGSGGQQPSAQQTGRPTYPPSSKPSIAQDAPGSQVDEAVSTPGLWTMIKTSPFWTLCALSFVSVYILGARQLFALAQVLSPSSSDVAMKRQEPAEAGGSSGATTWMSNHAPWLDGSGLFALINIWHVVFLTALIIVAMVIQDNAVQENDKTEPSKTLWQRMVSVPRSVWGFIKKTGSVLRLKNFGVVLKVLAVLLTIAAFAACLLYLDFLVSKLASVSATVAESEQTGIAALVLLNIVFLVFVPLLTFEFVLCLRAYLTWYRSKSRTACGGNSGSDAWACACISCPT